MTKHHTHSHQSATHELMEVHEGGLSPEMEDKINEMIASFGTQGVDYAKFKNILAVDDKKAYPNYDQYMYIPGQHNMQKWLESVRNLYRAEQSGQSYVTSIRQVTSGWNPMETYDFLNWLRFYQEGAHLKYKMAQLWYENGAPGYFLHVKQDPPKEPEPAGSGQEFDFARADETNNAEKRDVIEKQRNKIVGRLDSAEKLLRSRDGQLFAGPELEALMEAIYQLKKKIHLVNKVSISTRLYDDMIVREANVLQRHGFSKASEWLHSQAQANNPPPAGTGVAGAINILPPPAPPESPSAPLHPGAPGGLPSMGPGMSQNAPASTGVPEVGPNDNSPTNLKGVSPGTPPTAAAGPASPMPSADDIKSPGLNDFISNNNTGNIGEDKATAEDDQLEVEDALDVSDSDDELLVTEAQIAPPPPQDIPITDKPTPPRPPKPSPDMPATETPLEVTEDDVAQPPKGDMTPSPKASDFDAKVDAVFANISIGDVVAKLEDIAKIYKTRELPRQLGIVDMMLDSLGLASYFPPLSEAINKSLESNNYISTRIDEILSRLRGGMSSDSSIDLKGGPGSDKPEVAGIKNKLMQEDEKEKKRKQQRKEQEAAELATPGKETPEVEIEEDLGAKPPPRAPVAPPPARPLR